MRLSVGLPGVSAGPRKTLRASIERQLFEEFVHQQRHGGRVGRYQAISAQIRQFRPDSGLRLLESSDLTRERQVKFDGKTRELRESEDFERFTAAAAELQLVSPKPETRHSKPATRSP